MAEVLNDNKLNEILHHYLEKLRGKISIEKAILYGSYAKGYAQEHSDVDLLIISKDLQEKKTKGMNGLYLDRIVGDFDLRLEVIGIHPNKLNDSITKSFFEEIMTTGKIIC